jgi:hypothetical protein
MSGAQNGDGEKKIGNVIKETLQSFKEFWLSPEQFHGKLKFLST